jgi:hypothetical protein
MGDDPDSITGRAAAHAPMTALTALVTAGAVPPLAAPLRGRG